MEPENASQNDPECPDSDEVGMFLVEGESGRIGRIATRECVRGGMRQITLKSSRRMRGNALRIRVSIPQLSRQNTMKVFHAPTTRIASLFYYQTSVVARGDPTAGRAGMRPKLRKRKGLPQVGDGCRSGDLRI
jgi:hypothetical protein